ncbi:MULTISPECIES: hypothetical protein [Kribbella]|uniref:hypothetical protein n=1 Tax=Kribbella TaxID=182639 RepID=UPI0014170537|nr:MULTISPECIES: hypothetical protein [Kribbella]
MTGTVASYHQLASVAWQILAPAAGGSADPQAASPTTSGTANSTALLRAQY